MYVYFINILFSIVRFHLQGIYQSRKNIKRCVLGNKLYREATANAVVVETIFVKS